MIELKKRADDSRSYLKLSAVACVLLLVPPFFKLYLPSANYLTLGFIMVALLFLVAAASSTSCHSTRNRLDGHVTPLILLFVLMGVILVNNNRDLSAGEGLLWIAQFGGTLIAVGLLLLCPNDNWESTVFRAIALFGLFYAAATIIFWLIPNAYDVLYPYLQSKSAADITGAGYRAGLTTHYSTNGMYISLGFLASAFLALSRGKKKSAVWTVAAGLCLFALILTTKRAHLAFGSLAFAVSYLAFNSCRGLSSLGKFMLITATVLLLLYIVSFFNDDVLYVLERFAAMEDDDSFGGRREFYNLCLSMWEESPLFGCGWGSYTLRFNQTTLGIWYISQGFSSMDAHNVYLQLLAEEGVIGILPFVGALVGGILVTVKPLLRMNILAAEEGDCPDLDERRGLLAASLAVQLFFAMYCVTGNPLYDAQVFVPWLLALGVAMVLVRELPKSDSIGRNMLTGDVAMLCASIADSKRGVLITASNRHKTADCKSVSVCCKLLASLLPRKVNAALRVIAASIRTLVYDFVIPNLVTMYIKKIIIKQKEGRFRWEDEKRHCRRKEMHCLAKKDCLPFVPSRAIECQKIKSSIVSYGFGWNTMVVAGWILQ